MIELFGAVTPFLVLAMIPGLVQFFKEWLKLDGSAAQALTFGIALVLGIAVQLKELYAIFMNPWFDVFVYSLLFAMTASGYYKIVGAMIQKSKGQ